MSIPRISLIHPMGNPNSREAALALSEAGLLYEIITTIAYNPKGWVSRYLNLLPKTIKNRVADELGRRTWIASNGAFIRSHPWQEAMRIALIRTGLNKHLGFSLQETVDFIYAAMDRHVSQHHLQGLDGVYAYEDGAYATFKAAKQQGILCLYDLPILFYRMSRDIQTQEAKRFPEFASVLQAAKEPAWKIERKEQEINLADHIFVASSFVQNSLLEAGVNREKISVIPFGAPIDYFYPKPKTDKLFRALFVGRVGPRKGVHYLLQAWQQLQLPEAELLIVGINEFPEGYLDKYGDGVRYVPSVPHASLNEYYSSANVLVLPSLVEGLPLVVLEAMACGIPIITTPNAGVSDIITNGVEGFIVPVRDVEAVKQKLEWCYSHTIELAEMGQSARKQAEQLTWSLYRQRLASRVKQLLSLGNSGENP
ncbi:glycosyltransferase family 4 protein [Argonema antarcticum]|uniref:glycosyltransferase family 4 protein n=1 Tax=Argonema antarcticum TaxID=2942763 RepID=UPI00201142E9|nr:glycosyltransferase family 4 protein [Argonema antarcticum]MCL1470625.1 glycosyltransferase family 4 protein [Argonema antarcticum A004/B2]